MLPLKPRKEYTILYADGHTLNVKTLERVPKSELETRVINLSTDEEVDLVSLLKDRWLEIVESK